MSNRLVNIGLMGCGMYAGFHVRGLLATPGVRIAALCSRTQARMDSLIERRLGEVDEQPTCYTDPARMYEQEDLDGVIILTPPACHARDAEQALAAGCHVLVEKPMAPSIADCLWIAAAAEAAERHVLVGSNPPYTGAAAFLREAIRSKRYGDLRLVSVVMAQNWLQPTSGGWRHDPALAGGGQIADSGAHLLGGLAWTLGEPLHLSALQDHRGAAVDVDTAVLMQFPDGVPATLCVGGDSASDLSSATFVFEQAQITCDLWRGEWLQVHDADGSHAPELPADVHPASHFVEVIRGGTEPLTDAAHGLAVARLLEAIATAARSGERTALDATPLDRALPTS